MEYKQLESMLNPIRMKIIKEVAAKGTATTKEISEICQDIPQTTLYRNISRLLKDGILTIVAENKVRGILEKVYALKLNPQEEINKQAEQYSKGQLSDLFYQFLMVLLSDFQKYLSNDNVNIVKDGVGFHSYYMYLSDEELMEMARELSETLSKRMNNKPGINRKLRKLSTIMTPYQEGGEE